MIIASQFYEGQFEQVESLLCDLRTIRNARTDGQTPVGTRQPKPAGPITPQSPVKTVLFAPKPSATENAVREALEKPIDVRFKGTPLVDVIQQLKRTTALPIVVDQKALVDVDIPLTTPITLNASGRTLHAVLDELVESHKLAWTFDIERTSLVITTPEEEQALVTRSYDVSDLPSYRNEHGEGVPDYDMIVEAIEEAD